MKVARTLPEVGEGASRVCLCIGFFDGVHLGHQQIIRQTVMDARKHEAQALVVTFDRHPASVVRPQSTPPLIYSLEQRRRAIESCGADAMLLIAFDEAFSRLKGEEFIRMLASGLGSVRSVCVGANFMFGYQRSGNVDLLRKMGAELNFSVHGLAAVSLDNVPVSSTRIRETIRAGNLDLAGQMLGRGYSLAGTVKHGDALGRQLGFPTANIDVTGRALPPYGVYAAHALLESDIRRSVVNIGSRPTLQTRQPEVRVEAHLLDYEGDLYNRELELLFVQKIRDETRFDSLDDLRKQIAQDILEAQLRF